MACGVCSSLINRVQHMLNASCFAIGERVQITTLRVLQLRSYSLIDSRGMLTVQPSFPPFNTCEWRQNILPLVSAEVPDSANGQPLLPRLLLALSTGRTSADSVSMARPALD